MFFSYCPCYFIISSFNYLSSDWPVSDRKPLLFLYLYLNTNWSPIYNSNYVNEAYSYFESKINESYYQSFKVVRLSRKRIRIRSGLHLA